MRAVCLFRINCWFNTKFEIAITGTIIENPSFYSDIRRFGWPSYTSVVVINVFPCDRYDRYDRYSLSIRRFWGKGERWKRKRERAEGEKRLPFSSLRPPSPI